MTTAPTQGERGQGLYLTHPLYEGTATRTDVVTEHGVVKGGVAYAAQFDEDAIDRHTAYVKEYTSFAEMAYQKVATGDNGNLIKGRVVNIDTNIGLVDIDLHTRVDGQDD